MRVSLALLAGAMLLVLGLVATSWRSFLAPWRTTSSPQNADVFRNLEAIKRELREVRSTSHVQLAHVLNPQQMGASTAGDDEDAEPTKSADDNITSERRMEQAVLDMEERFFSEPKDRSWSAIVEAQIRDSVSAKAPAARIFEAECAASLCRVVLAHESIEQQSEIAHSLQSMEPFRQGVLFDYDSDHGPPRTTLYVLRDGYSFRDDRDEMSP